MSVCTERALIARHFEAALSPREEREMREHLSACADCRKVYERQLLFARLDPNAMSAEDRIGRGLGLPPSQDRPANQVQRRSLFSGLRSAPLAMSFAAIVAMAAAVFLFVRAPGRATDDDGFTARRANPHPAPVTSRIFVYDVHAEPRPLRSGDSFARGDELALAYQNGLAKTRLMVFGVDEHHHVYWFYPAWTHESDDPVAVPIATDAARHELPDAVHHAFDGNSLEVHALFVDAPISVKQVEALVAKHATGSLPIPGSVESTTSFTLSP